MDLLIDTNIVLEILLDQDRAAEARRLLEAVDEHSLYMSSFSIDSIGLRLFRSRRYDDLSNFISDVNRSGISVVTLSTADFGMMIETAQAHDLDFDDAYQVTVAQRHNLTIVSYDADFDRAPSGRRTPAAILSA